MLIINLLDIMLSVLFFSQISGALCAPSIHQHDFLFTTTHCKFLGFLFFIFLQDTILIGRLLGPRK